MQALIVPQPGEIKAITKEVPSIRDGEALIRIRRVGICGTDYHAFHGRQPYFQYPRILGHELAGEIVELPPGETRFKIGERVTVIPYLECGTCQACRNNKPNACIDLKVLGVHQDGGMQEYLPVPIYKLMSVEGISWEQAVIIEPLAISAHAVNRVKIQPGDRALVVGAGPIGLAAMVFARLAGAEVIAIDLDEARLDFAKKWARCHHTIHAAREDVKQKLLSLTDGALPLFVFDATGNKNSMEKAFDYAAHSGQIVYISLVKGNITFSDPDFHKKELTLYASRGATRSDFEQVLNVIRSGEVDEQAFITHTSPFADGVQAFLSWTRPESAVIKAVLNLD